MYGKIKEHLQQELAEIKAAGLYKSERVITSPQRAEIEVAGRKVLNFCANNYLGLSDNPRLIEAAKKAMEKQGNTEGAHRLGTLFSETKEKLTEFQGQGSLGLDGIVDYFYKETVSFPQYLDPERTLFTCIMRDVTKARQRRNKIQKTKIHAADLADDIIANQLRIVHEIASLLGETAAETKVAVHDLKEAIMLDEDGDDDA